MITEEDLTILICVFDNILFENQLVTLLKIDAVRLYQFFLFFGVLFSKELAISLMDKIDISWRFKLKSSTL
jgi:hypothetical protein